MDEDRTKETSVPWWVIAHEVQEQRRKDGRTEGNNSLQDKFRQLYISMYSEMRANEKKNVVDLKRAIIARNPLSRAEMIEITQEIRRELGTTDGVNTGKQEKNSCGSNDVQTATELHRKYSYKCADGGGIRIRC
jgi:hypothetical protein